MKKYFAVVAVSIATLGTPGLAQEQKPSLPSSTTIRVQVVLARYQGDKKISSLPYTLSVNTDERNRNTGTANLRLGTQVPITTMARQNGDANSPLVPTVQYKDVGTNLDCTVTGLDDGRFKLNLIIEDSSIDTTPGTVSSSAHPAFRSFRTSDTMMLRDGQSAQYSTATDKISSDVWKVDVTLNVVK